MKKISNAWICSIKNGVVEPIFGDLYFEKNIVEIKPSGETANWNIDEEYNAAGKVITIANVNFHDHIYSRLAKGLAIKGPMDNFQHILDSLWWKLDSLLDTEMVEASIYSAAIDSIKSGVLYIFDHHSSPNANENVLSLISETLSEFGVWSNVAIEISDRNGNAITNKLIDETYNFYKLKNETSNLSIGLHASYTIDDATLEKISQLFSKTNIGIHVHVSEDKIDKIESINKFGLSPIDRLVKFNLLNNNSIIAHCNHLNSEDFSEIEKHNSAIVFSPESNLNNNVGVADYLSISKNIPVLCGTDGMHSKPFQSLKTLFLLARDQGNSFDEVFQWISRIYFSQIDFICKYQNNYSLLNEGEEASFIMWDYTSPTPITSNNFFGHYLYGIIESNVNCVIANGKFLMKDFTLSLKKDYNEAIQKAGNRLYEKFNLS